MRPSELRLAHPSPPLSSQNLTYSHTLLARTIHPSAACASVLALLPHFHPAAAPPPFPAHVRIRTAERVLTLSELFGESAAGTRQEVLRGHRGCRHLRCAHRVTAPAPRREYRHGSGSGGDRAAPGRWAGSLAQAVWRRVQISGRP